MGPSRAGRAQRIRCAQGPPEERDALTASIPDLEEDDGSTCTIVFGHSSDVKIPDKVLESSWASLVYKAHTIDGVPVRSCQKKAKQVATLGPASCTDEHLERLFLCGVDIFRLNFSHGSQEEKTELVERIRSLEAKYAHPICILADMQGPKQRCGKFAKKEGVQLKAGQRFRFDLDEALGDETRVCLPHPEILVALDVGRMILLDDGKVRMRVVEKGYTWQGKDTTLGEVDKRPSDSVDECPPFIVCEVLVSGKLSACKGVNTPDVVLPISAITPKDREDVVFACSADVDWIALSFVQRHEDMVELRALVDSTGGNKPKILAKIEKPSAVQDLDAILEASDGIMVARGDLGVEMNPEEVPFVQKEMVGKAQALGKPVIVATQMLESMIECPAPTRAECSDIANAVMDGCSAVMLSGETAVGKYPAEAVEIQRRVIDAAERRSSARAIDAVVSQQAVGGVPATLNASNALAASAVTLAKGLGAKALICFTATGRSAQRLVQLYPSVPILAVCPCAETARWLCLFRGVYATSDPDAQALAGRVATQGARSVRFSEALEIACNIAREKGLATSEDDSLVVISRLPLFTKGRLNCIRVVTAQGPKGENWDLETN